MKAALAIALTCAVFIAPANSALAADHQAVAIYRVVTLSNYTDVALDRWDRFAFRDDYFLIITPGSQWYRTVKLHSNRKYRADQDSHSFSQAFTSVDAANRGRLVLSFEGPGRDWQHWAGEFSAYGTTETAVGLLRTRSIPTAFFGRRQIQVPTVLRGQGRYERANWNGSTREFETSRTIMRYHAPLTNLSNSLGGHLWGGQDTVVDFLEARGWENLFGDQG